MKKLSSPDLAARLADAALALRPLIAAAGGTVRVDTTSNVAAVQAGLDRVASGLRVVARGEPVGVFDRVASEHLRRHRLDAAAKLAAAAPGEVEAVAAEVAARSFEARCDVRDVTTPDGATLRAYAAGVPGRRTVVLAAACGMPARLCEGWLSALSADYHVIVWESRALFPVPAAGDTALDATLDLAAQARDLVAVLDAYGVAQADAMGICGGAVIALQAAADHPERIRSLALWHGDYDFGPDSPRTTFQRNLRAVLSMGGRSRAAARGVHATLCKSGFANVPPDVAHLVIYPYVTPELLYRYSRLNHALMAADVPALAPRVTQPALVVTSRNDDTAHPAGSHRLADELPDGRLHVEDTGTHILAFSAPPPLVSVALDFLARVPAAEAVVA